MSNQSIAELIETSKKLHNQIGNKIADSTHSNRDDLIPAVCFDIVREYQAAVIILIEKNLYHSAYVLTRSIFETFIRGAWFKNCANLEQINNFKQGNNPPSINTLISNLEETPLYQNNILSTYKEGYIQPNHSDEEISDLLNFINILVLLASIETASLAENQKLEEELYLKLKNM